MAALWGHSGVRFVAAGWLGFITENLVLSENRTYIIETFGEETYHGLYNTLSSVACVSIAYGYFRHGRGQGPVLWSFPHTALGKLGATTCTGVGLVGFSQLAPKLQIPVALNIGGSSEAASTPSPSSAPSSLVSPPPTPSTPSTNENSEIAAVDVSSAKPVFQARCPIDFSARRGSENEVYGIDRVTRHGALYSLGFLGLGGALATVYATEMITFGGFALFSLLGTHHIDDRHRRGMGGTLTKEREDLTSNLPFLALLTGRQSWSGLWDETKGVNACLALGLTSIIAFRRGQVRAGLAAATAASTVVK